MRENPGCVDRDALARPAEVLEGMVKSVLASAGQVGQEIVDAHGFSCAKSRGSGRRVAAAEMKTCSRDVHGPAPSYRGGQRCDGDVARSEQRGKLKARRTRERPVVGSEEGGGHALSRVEAETCPGGTGPWPDLRREREVRQEHGKNEHKKKTRDDRLRELW